MTTARRSGAGWPGPAGSWRSPPRSWRASSAAFILGNDPIVKLFGVALSTAVLLDAFVVRLILVPSLMTIFGKANWWLPGWLDRLLPHISVESEHDVEAGAAEIVDIASRARSVETAGV